MLRHIQVAGRASLFWEEALCRFWEPSALRAFWPSIERFDVQYDDGMHQDGIMHVVQESEIIQIRVVRFRRAREILFFNPKPPPAMISQCGAWRFEEDPTGGCIVRADRWYRLSSRAAESNSDFNLRDSAFAALLSARLKAILEAFASRASEFPGPLR